MNFNRLKVKPDLDQVSESYGKHLKLSVVLKVMTYKKITHSRKLGLQLLIDLLVCFLHLSLINISCYLSPSTIITNCWPDQHQVEREPFPKDELIPKLNTSIDCIIAAFNRTGAVSWCIYKIETILEPVAIVAGERGNIYTIGSRPCIPFTKIKTVFQTKVYSVFQSACDRENVSNIVGEQSGHGKIPNGYTCSLIFP